MMNCIDYYPTNSETMVTGEYDVMSSGTLTIQAVLEGVFLFKDVSLSLTTTKEMSLSLTTTKEMSLSPTTTKEVSIVTSMPTLYTTLTSITRGSTRESNTGEYRFV